MSNAVQQTQPQPQHLIMLNQSTSQIQLALGPGGDAKRFIRTAITEFRSNPKLITCSPESFMLSLHEAARLGLEVGAQLGQFYLIPRGSQCVPMLGYRGMIVLGLRHKDVKNITATAVFKGDYFEHGENTEGQWFDYKPCGNKNPEELERVFAVGRLKDTVVIDVMERAEIEQARAKSQMPNGNAWRNHYAEMARKTAVRRLFKYLPMEPVVEAAIAKDEERWSDNTDKPDLDKYRKALAMAEAKRMSLESMEAVVVSSESDIITEKKGGES